MKYFNLLRIGSDIYMKCRCCGLQLPEVASIHYSNMPKSAQYFPDAEHVKAERGVNLELFQCHYCGMIQLGGYPVPYYRDVIRASGVSKEMREFRKNFFLKWIRKYRLQGKKILEIGCGAGEYISIMQEIGANVYGIEHLASSVDKDILNGYKVFNAFIESEEFQIPKAPYDAFYILNFLEHIPCPGEFLRGIANNLSNGAVGIIEVPNMDMILKRHLYSELIQDHLLYFTADTLKLLLSMNGFEILSCYSCWHEYILRAEVKKREALDLKEFYKSQKYIQNDVDKFLDLMKSQNISVAIWGAGHQSLANLSILNIKKYVCCVIDSAEFKQNRYTPATHIPVVSPDILEKGKIGAVLIMAAGYSNEINEIIKRKYPEIISVTLGVNGIEKN